MWPTMVERIGGRGVKTLPEHASCKNHDRYWLTCEQYEGLIEASGNRCQICGVAASSCIPHRKLFIDHDQGYGIWAVRGLLCPQCNANCRWDKPDPEWALDYLCDPWFERAFAEMGVPIEPQPEPPIGSVFQSPKRTRWVREERWWQNQSFIRSYRDWRGMCRDFSPVHLQHIRVPAPPPSTVTLTIRPNDPRAVADLLREHMTPQQRNELAFLIGED